MKLKISAKILGLLLMCFSLSMLTPIPVSIYYNDGDVWPFSLAFAITITTGFFLWLYGRNTRQELRTRDGFLIVFLMWLVLGAFGMLPFMLSYSPHIPWTDALFESVSGLTTTGATTLVNIDSLPRAVLYYRQQLQFLGGMGIIVLAIAVMPLIGVGGMQLYKAEITGPIKDNKITPHLAETAKALWLIYVGVSMVCILCYWGCGMPLFDAVGYAFSTISTGGYAPHDSSIAFYHSNIINIVCMIFMIIGGTNFSLHFLVFRRLNWRSYWHDTEFRAYIIIIIVAGLVISLGLRLMDVYHSLPYAFMNGFFQVISFLTTTGFTTTSSFAIWPLFFPMFLLFLGISGACAGSTTGGIKLIRGILLKKQISQEIKTLIHPHGMFPVKVNNKIVPQQVMNGVWAFIAAYIFVFILLWLALLATGENDITAFSAVAACISNVGPGLGGVSDNFSTITPFARGLLILAMLIGRLEVFTVLVLLSPAFWRR